MDGDGKESNSRKVKSVGSLDGQKIELPKGEEGGGESDALLPPRKGGISRKTEKVRRKVQWNDKNGNKLAEVLEFQPSDESDSDDEEFDSCICAAM